MALLLGAAGSERIVGRGTTAFNTLTLFAIGGWYYPTTLTGSRRLWTWGTGTTSNQYLQHNATTASKLEGFVARATTAASAIAAAGTVTLNEWQYLMMTYSEASGIKLFRGTLTTPLVEVTYDVAPTVGTGATTSTTGNLAWGNSVSSLSAPTASFRGRFGRGLVYNAELVAAELARLQFGHPAHASLRQWIEAGYAGTDIHSDGSGYGNHAYVVGATVTDHMPLPSVGAPSYALPKTLAVPPASSEPSGYTLVSERQWATKGEGWLASSEVTSGNYTIEPDPTAPSSPMGIGRMTYPVGFVGGSAPSTIERTVGSGYRNVFLQFWCKWSSNFQGHSTSTNKVIHLFIAAQNRLFFSVEGAGAGDLQPQLRLQSAPDARPRFLPNLVPAALAVRGEWHQWEILARTNTAGVANGELHLWLDGVKISEYTDVQFISGVESPTWETLQWSPTWGGSGDSVTAAMTLDVDRLYLSGSTLAVLVPAVRRSRIAAIKRRRAA